ncbi:outer membrane lipoprotein-sorting protein [Verrucomicrobia bacterium LW23]|nr:outer membrane lipoprotein-sorting protein [Verrucomicrobia bacterium LW23]
MKLLRPLAATAAAFLIALAPAAAAPDTSKAGTIPPIDAVKAHMWKCLQMGSFEMTGEFRASKATHPITLHTNGNEMIYTFLKQPLQIRVVASPTQSIVQTRASSTDKWADVTGAARLKSVLGTDVTYEDLSLDFLRWPKVTPYGTDNVKTVDCFVFDAVPAGPSQFSKVRYWLTARECAFLKLEGMNAKGEVIKREEVMAVTQIKNMVMFKELVIATTVPGKGNVSLSRTFITIRNIKVIRAAT